MAAVNNSHALFEVRRKFCGMPHSAAVWARERSPGALERLSAEYIIARDVEQPDPFQTVHHKKCQNEYVQSGKCSTTAAFERSELTKYDSVRLCSC